MGLKSKLAMAVVTSAAGAAMIAGGSFALFTATATNSSNTFTAGNITLDENTPTWAASATLSNIAPGDAGQFGQVTLQNNGSLDEWVRLQAYNDGDQLFKNQADNGSDGQPDNHPLNVSYSAGAVTAITGSLPALPYSVVNTGSSPVSISSWEPSDLSAAGGHAVPATASSSSPNNEYVFLPAHSQVTVTYKYSFDQAAGNLYMLKSGVVTVKADSVQARNNTTADATVGGTGGAPTSGF